MSHNCSTRRVALGKLIAAMQSPQTTVKRCSVTWGKVLSVGAEVCKSDPKVPRHSEAEWTPRLESPMEVRGWVRAMVRGTGK